MEAEKTEQRTNYFTRKEAVKDEENDYADKRQFEKDFVYTYGVSYDS